MNISGIVAESTNTLLSANTDSPRRSALMLAEYALGMTHTELLTKWDTEVSEPQKKHIRALTERRAAGEPAAYITGIKEFYGRDFRVSRDTLIPRPETELLTERALQCLSTQERLNFADLGTGSGCIGITLLCEAPAWHGILVDTSEEALHIARQNATELSVSGNAKFIRCDMCSCPVRTESLDLCIGNPPYVRQSEIHLMDKEVYEYEPHSALFSGDNGLYHLKGAIREAARMLKCNGRLLLEHGESQGRETESFLHEQGFWKDIKIHKDFAGLDRFCEAIKI